MLEANPKTVKVVFKNFPLRRHQHARPAATAAIAAGRQGQFWPYHDRLFKNADKLGEPLYNQIAKELGLDMARFAKDRTSAETQAQIDQDLRDGNQAGVRGTPTIYVNGRKLSRVRIKEFQELIDRVLATDSK